MSSKIALCLTLIVLFAALTLPVQAVEPTWLFTVPKAESLEKDTYNIGFLYADFGMTENLELGLHGVKYSIPGSDLAFGFSIVPMGSPYVVKSLRLSSGSLHLGLKATPYVFFAGLDLPVSDKVKFVAELSNGPFVGVRIFPADKWTLDIFAGFVSFEVYKYKYSRIKVEEFHPLPGIFFAYSDRF